MVAARGRTRAGKIEGVSTQGRERNPERTLGVPIPPEKEQDPAETVGVPTTPGAIRSPANSITCP